MSKSPMSAVFVLSADAYGLRLRYAPPSQSRHPLSGWDGLRRSLGRSLMRMVEVATYLEHHSVAPSHMITLTLPPEAWENLDRDEALERFKRARMLFLKALSARLASLGFSSSYFWWLEIQKRGAPHIHLLLDLGGRLSPRDYEAWCAWVSAEWSRALGVEAPYATRFELLFHRDFRYLKAYVRKVHQKSLPFPGRWGKTYGLGGRWLEIVREARRSPRSVWSVGAEGVVRVIEGIVGALRAASAGVGEFVATADELIRWVRGLMPMYEVARAWAFGERVPVPDEVDSWRPFRVRFWWPEVLGSPRREAFLAGILMAISAVLT